MALDANGNWYPNMPNPLPGNTACSRKFCVSDGAPSNNVGNDGDLIISRADGTIYEKVSGSWVVFPGYTGSSGFNNLSGNGSPVGVVTPNYINQFYQDKTPPRDIWVSTGVTNTSWLLLLQDVS